MDECIPTIKRCRVDDTDHEDHGDVWASAWAVDDQAWAQHIIATDVVLPVTNLQLRREVGVKKSEIKLQYTLHNPGSTARAFLWSLHPLLNWDAGDHIELSQRVRSVKVETSSKSSLTRETHWNWPEPSANFLLNRGMFAENQPRSAKVFAGSETGGWAKLQCGSSGEALSVFWDPSINPWLGLWINRGGWRGHHHVALEPTTSPCDSLADALNTQTAAILDAGHTRTWFVRFQLQSAASR